VGGGASGTAAGISAGRLGTKTLIIEPTPWLGGMLTSAGVSAIDGNHQLPSSGIG
jgi:predicted flavoprotein YhiN